MAALTDARRRELVQLHLEQPQSAKLTARVLAANVQALEAEGFVRKGNLGPLVRSCPIGLERVQGVAVSDPATGQSLAVQVVFTLTTRRRRAGIAYVSVSVLAFDAVDEIELTQKRSAVYRHDQWQGERVQELADDEVSYRTLLSQRTRAPLDGGIDFERQPRLFVAELLRQLTP